MVVEMKWGEVGKGVIMKLKGCTSAGKLETLREKEKEEGET